VALSLFSLSEHLAFAASALPLAALLAAFAVLGWIALPIMFSWSQSRTKFLVSNSIRLVCLVWGLSSIVFGVFQSTSTIVIIGLAFLLGAGSTLIHSSSLPPSAIGVAAISFLIWLSVAMGLDATRFNLKVGSALPIYRLTAIQAVETTYHGVVLRTGERGVLFFDAQSALFRFEKWEAIKAINWPRRRLVSACEILAIVKFDDLSKCPDL
jgi:hypothetical protein